MDSWGKTANKVMTTGINFISNRFWPDTGGVQHLFSKETDNCLVVLSGGMDSATCLGLAKKIFTKVECITFNYGQQHTIEITKAIELANYYNTPCKVINLNGLADNFNTALKKDSDLEIPETATGKGIVPPTYVPFRNTIMLSIALGYAESWGFNFVMYGANIVDYSGYPDCRPEYIDAMNTVATLHNKIKIIAPIVYLDKSEIVKLGYKLEVPFKLTWSCYRGGEKSCGKCPSCEYRLKGFREAGVQDPIEYQS